MAGQKIPERIAIVLSINQVKRGVEMSIEEKRFCQNCGQLRESLNKDNICVVCCPGEYIPDYCHKVTMPGGQVLAGRTIQGAPSSAPAAMNNTLFMKSPAPMKSGDCWNERSISVRDGYEPLFRVLAEALDQAQAGKGRERHANGRPFMEQPIIKEAEESGVGFLCGQVRKKILEAKNCPDLERAKRDILGSIVYASAMVLFIEREAGKLAAPVHRV